jgi:hypothetical protein
VVSLASRVSTQVESAGKVNGDNQNWTSGSRYDGLARAVRHIADGAYLLGNLVKHVTSVTEQR